LTEREIGLTKYEDLSTMESAFVGTDTKGIEGVEDVGGGVGGRARRDDVGGLKRGG